MSLKYFDYKELVPPELFKRGESYCIGLFVGGLLEGLDRLRGDLGFPIYVNYKGLTQCGYRLRNSSTGAANSPHKQGKALDLHTDTAEQLEALYAYIAKLGAKYGIRRMEHKSKTPTWVHVDVVEHDRPGVRVFYP